ncbi:sphingolipid delta(4)-desaturase DES1-like isoform X2 [Schistocerca gregaria]|uniref:sphingolipid delta(4)-desaturase DES1-like isoform X2 n=1 Tax=Schistocerca gregaria TaxID=7010 RepID=UPI00211F2C58|nr:sphingolipid delta(4)-desaturase DES1-like isoform X2 [Schistocerca gregaria]
MELNNKKDPLKDTFTWVYDEEPHATRRREILREHPEIRSLFGIDTKSKYWITLTVSLQVLTAVFMRDASWTFLLITSYIWGGTLNHSLSLGIHELSHNLMFSKPIHNTFFSFFANLPIAVPYSITFQKYHMMHHQYQGQYNIDPDLPMAWEGYFFNSASTKALFLFAQPLIYTLVPLANQYLPFTYLELLQMVIQFTFDFLVVYLFGIRSLIYLLCSTFFGSSLHPMAGHFVSEHYEWVKGQETYSYYGPLNKVTYNAGYHYEHHDFPRVPGSRLVHLKAIAPEYYDHLYSHKSWVAVMLRFIFDPSISPFSRIIRPSKRGLYKHSSNTHEKRTNEVK